MPTPPKRLRPARSAADWFGAELRHHRLAKGLTQTQLGQAVFASGAQIGKIEKAERRCTRELAEQCDKALETGGVLARAWGLMAAEADKIQAQTDSSSWASGSAEPAWKLGGDQLSAPEQSVNRRTFLAASIGWPTLMATDPNPGEPITNKVRLVELAEAVTSYGGDTAMPLDLKTLDQRVATVKRDYQACRYTYAIATLTPLLHHVRATLSAVDNDQRCQAQTVAAAAFQVAARILLKFGDGAIAAMAADRSMSAAVASQDPVAVGSSARAVTHTLMRSGHHRNAARLAATEAERLDTGASVAGVSVQGALLLRGCITTARSQDRAATTELLDTAEAAAQRLSERDNHQWTGFNPVNVLLHRVHTAVVLGDAGQAIEIARTIDINQIELIERQACLAIDVATAYTQWGRYEKALNALRLAESSAPEEARARSNVKTLLDRLYKAGPPSLKPHVTAFARQLETAA